MIVFRLCKGNFSRDLSGKGAEKYGGRWNSEGLAVVYTSDSRALSALEISVHLPLSIMPAEMHIVSLEIPDNFSVQLVNIDDLHSHWRQFPYHPSTQKIGDNWIKENRYMILKVPSAVIMGDYNYLINPNHGNFGKIKILSIENFNFDSRLFDQ